LPLHEEGNVSILVEVRHPVKYALRADTEQTIVRIRTYKSNRETEEEKGSTMRERVGREGGAEEEIRKNKCRSRKLERER
jgi:hypothetical protein